MNELLLLLAKLQLLKLGSTLLTVELARTQGKTSGRAVVEREFPSWYVKNPLYPVERACTDVTNEHVTPQCCPRSSLCAAPDRR